MKKITVAVGYPERENQWALLKAAAMAEQCGARLTLLHTFSTPYPLTGSNYRSTEELIQTASASRRAQLEALVERLGLRQRVSFAVEWDYPVAAAIVRHVLRTEPDLLVADSHRHGRVGRWLLTNTDWDLIRSVPCPLWFVKSPVLPRRPRALVAVDPVHADAEHSGLDVATLRMAHRLHRDLGVAVSLAHVLEPSAGDGSAQDEAAARLAIDQLARRQRFGAARRAFGRGDPSEALMRLATAARCDLVVMGAISRRSRTAAFIGSTAERVIDQLRCDVLIVKAPTFRTDVAASRTTRA